jgi:hypothetical protein
MGETRNAYRNLEGKHLLESGHFKTKKEMEG